MQLYEGSFQVGLGSRGGMITLVGTWKHPRLVVLVILRCQRAARIGLEGTSHVHGPVLMRGACAPPARRGRCGRTAEATPRMPAVCATF